MLREVNLDCAAQWDKRWNCVRTFVDQKATWTSAVWYKLIYVHHVRRICTILND
jgi:hypothetical protein